MAAPASPVRYDISAFHGREISIDISLKQADGTTAQSLTGATLTAEIRQGYSADDPLLASMTVSVTDAAAGEATVSLPIATVDTLVRGIGIGFWRCLLTLPAATSPIAVFEGAVSVS